MTALHMAVQREEGGVVRLLVKAGAKGDLERLRLTYQLIRAACKGAPEMGMERGYPLYPGVLFYPKNAPGLKEVLKQDTNVNMADGEGYTALMYAATLGLVENVETLLANGADTARKSRNGDTASSLAGRPGSLYNPEGRRQVVELLSRRWMNKH
jgi:ankyrin repeat protein